MGVKAMLARSIQLVDKVTKQCGAARCFRVMCVVLKSHTDKLATLLCQEAWADLYDRPAAGIMAGVAQMLAKASSLAVQCVNVHLQLRWLFTLSPAAGFPRCGPNQDCHRGHRLATPHLVTSCRC